MAITLKKYRSGLIPQINNLSQGLINNNDKMPIIMSTGTEGEVDTIHGKPPSIIIFADIYGNQKMSF